MRTERSVVKLDVERLNKKFKHWQGVIISACEQCGRNQVPQIDATILLERLPDVLERQSLKLLMEPGATTKLKDIEPVSNQFQLLVGPEGGFSESEIAYVSGKQFQSISLGPRILRTETAALSLISAVHALWGDFC